MKNGFSHDIGWNNMQLLDFGRKIALRRMKRIVHRNAGRRKKFTSAMRIR